MTDCGLRWRLLLVPPPGLLLLLLRPAHDG